MNNTNLLKTGFVNERFRYYEKLVAELTMMSDMFMRNVLSEMPSDIRISYIFQEHSRIPMELLQEAGAMKIN